jgi:hypothetical protein
MVMAEVAGQSAAFAALGVRPRALAMALASSSNPSTKKISVATWGDWALPTGWGA